MKLVNKIAFLVHEPTLYTHYSGVWAEMDPSDFVIVLYYNFYEDLREGKSDKYSGVNSFISKIGKRGYEYCFFDDVLRKKIKYRYVVSNHKISGSSMKHESILRRQKLKLKNIAKGVINISYKIVARLPKYQYYHADSVQYAPLQIGIYQIRFMYGADIGDGWSLQDWNEMYDLFLCHGPNDEQQLKKRFKGKTAIMGYPRYDRYFSSNLDTSHIISEFGIDLSKKTLLWMPTLGDGACSIPYYAKVISDLFDSYNVIVRPHPISFRQEPEKIDLLRSLEFQIDDES